MKSSFVWLKAHRVLAVISILFLFLTLFLSMHGTNRGLRAAGTNSVSSEGTHSQTPTPSTGTYRANLDLEPAGNYGTYSQAALANPNIGAVVINLNWADVEAQQGVYNWTPADNEMAAWAAKGKKFTFVVRYVDEGTYGTNCAVRQRIPAWEIARIPTFCDTDKGTIIPDYFNTQFQTDLKGFVQAVADHFAQSPNKSNLLYVRIGLGEGGEGFPVMRSGRDYQQDWSKLVAWGYSPQNWAAWQKNMLSFYQNAFSYTTIIYPVNGLDVDPSTGMLVQYEVGLWAAARGMGLGQQGLRPGLFVPLFTDVRSQYPNAYIQFQTGTAVGSVNTVQGDVQTAAHYGAQFIEWYSQNATNPSYQSLLQQFAANTIKGGN